MALPPTIPTSFVPRSAAATAQRFRADFPFTFGFLAYVILGVVSVLALAVFFYGRILSATQSAKDTALAKVEATIDHATVAGFVRLRNRLNSSTTLLDEHASFSHFFTLLGTLLPLNVRFTSLHLSLDTMGKAQLDGVGVAKSFNALAAVSTAFASDGRVKDAIFSNIVVDAGDNSVSFALTATLDQELVTFTP